jgi:hypothetical protein
LCRLQFLPLLQATWLVRVNVPKDCSWFNHNVRRKRASAIIAICLDLRPVRRT